MALSSPGTQVTIIDESQYLPAAPNSVPLIVIATAQNKANASGTGVAVGTTAANANKLYAITSQRDLVTYFGNPFFYKTTNGTPIQGYELNEYGLLAAYSALGATNLAYVIRANVDLAALVGRTGRPSAAVTNGTYWMNSGTSTWGIFEFNSVTGVFTNKIPRVIKDVNELSGNAPLSSIGNIGDYAVVQVYDYGQPDTYSTYWFKNANNTWVAVGSGSWQQSLPAVQGALAPSTVTVGNIVIKKDTAAVSVSGYVDDNSTPGLYSGVAGTTLRVATVATGALTVGTYISGTGITAGTYITALGTGTGGAGTYTVSVSQAAAATTISGYNAYIIPVRTAPNNTVANLAADITAQNIPFLTVLGDTTTSGRLTFYSTKSDGSVTITSDSTPGTLSSLGIVAGTYAAPALKYGTNAQQPLWRSTDVTPHPSGSVWIKTNNINSGANIVMAQYDSATGTYTRKPVTIATSDWAVNAALDSSGGKAIALNTVYAQAGGYSSGADYSAPIQLFSRTTTGASTFVGTVTSPALTIGGEFKVQVSVAGSSALSAEYTVLLTGNNAESFVIAWTAANIPNTTAVISAAGSIVLTHTQGGVIVLDDSPSVSLGNPSPLTEAGFATYDPATSTGTVGAKYGPYKTIDHTAGTPVLPSGGTGTLLDLEVTTNGYDTTVTIVNAGSAYSLNDQLSVTVGGVTYALAVTATGVGGAVTSLAIVSGEAIPQYSVQLSNWEVFEYITDDTAPVAAPANGTPWFYSVANQVDIMTNYGGEWFGYNNIKYGSNGLPVTGANAGNNSEGPICQASEPETQSDGTPLVYGDLWIDTGDLENYPVISRWQQVSGLDQWVLIDNTDQTSENGILFADARWSEDQSTVDTVNDPIPSITSLLSSDNLDLDAPSGSEYPQGTLLFNTRRSGYNVKEFRNNYFNSQAFPDTTLPNYAGTWVTVSGNMTTGAPYMGRKAQRAMVVKAMKVCIDTSIQMREDQTFFNLIAAPNYCEVQPNLVALNNDRNNTAYIIGDTPLRLSADANDITAWATNAAGATSTGEQGLVTRDTYLGIYYPSAITTDLTGAEVVVPSSHMMIRVMIRNDNVAYPWFAPAGQRRGVVDNANNIGYIDSATGEFVTTQNGVALRDVEYNNFINPIAFFTNLGLLNYGNKNSFDSQSALDRTNVARLICYLRERLQIAVRPFLFEPNDSITRTQARAVVQTLLADIMTKRGIYDYLCVCDESNNTPARIDRNEMWIDVAIEPTKAVEFIYIPVRILNTGEIAGL